jgi:hypothetical protein
MKETKRLTAREYDGIHYVLGSDIVKFHGKKWAKKYTDVAGPGNTGIIVPANHPSHKKRKYQFGIYMWDYERFADVVDFGTPTYFD